MPKKLDYKKEKVEIFDNFYVDYQFSVGDILKNQGLQSLEKFEKTDITEVIINNVYILIGLEFAEINIKKLSEEQRFYITQNLEFRP